MTESRLLLTTGVSSGFGRALAQQALLAGHRVVGTVRSETARQDFEALAPGRAFGRLLDVTDAAAIDALVTTVEADIGAIDVLVNNAGYGSYGSVEEVPLSTAQAQLDVNVLGLARMAQLVIPGMRAQGSGRILNVSSMGGRFAMPMGAWYHASKYAVEGLSDALRMELAPFGIDVVLIEPGSIRTEWGGIAAGNLQEVSGDGPYARQAAAMAVTIGGSSGPTARLASRPEVVAKAVVKASTAKHPRTRYLPGFGAKPLVFLRAVLPDRAFDALIARGLGG